jgi:hypothetical protein
MNKCTAFHHFEPEFLEVFDVRGQGMNLITQTKLDYQANYVDPTDNS